MVLHLSAHAGFTTFFVAAWNNLARDLGFDAPQVSIWKWWMGAVRMDRRALAVQERRLFDQVPAFMVRNPRFHPHCQAIWQYGATEASATCGGGSVGWTWPDLWGKYGFDLRFTGFSS